MFSERCWTFFQRSNIAAARQQHCANVLCQLCVGIRWLQLPMIRMIYNIYLYITLFHGRIII
uniref:Uncharacterized protein n=1 Tax=Anguilla anguilla TaxID=7936 RepID=A0A0E9Q1K1_ANGAN